MLSTVAFGLARPTQLPDIVIGQGTTTAELKAVAFNSLNATQWDATVTFAAPGTYEPSAFGNSQFQFAFIIPQCEVPDLTDPLGTDPVEVKGLRSNTTYTYGFDMTSLWEAHKPSGQPFVDFAAVSARIRAGFKMWEDANKASGLNATFVEAPADQAQIKVRLKLDPSEDNKAPSVSASFGGTRFSVDRTLSTGTLHFYATNAESPDYFFKMTIHELGHGHGLRDSLPDTKPGRPSFGLRQTSIMNNNAFREDAGRNMPNYVTACDRKAAKDAADRPLP